MPAKIIAIALHKGGVGKTVTAMALAAGLARSGKKTLLVDLDPQGHSSLGLNAEPEPQEPTIRDFFESRRTLREVIKETEVPGLFVAPSNLRLAQATHGLYARPKREEILKKGLKELDGEFDFIVVDCPPSLGPLVEMGVGAADLIVVPSLMEARATDALQDLLELVTIIKGDGFTNWRILLTKVDQRKTITNQAVMTALEPWAGKLFRTQIPQCETLNQAQIARQDIYRYDPKGRGALAYQALIEELAQGVI